MSLSEFALIERFFTGLGAERGDVTLGCGDDAALVEVGGTTLALAVDTMIEDVHFPADAPPASIGHKLLAVNLSDLAAMGAEPAWALLALTLPAVDENWLTAMRGGLDALARTHGLALIGGDTTRGERLTASLFVGGPVDNPLRRDGARPGDVLWVSGWPGEAAAGLACWQAGERGDDVAPLIERLHRPTPRIALGRALRGLATAAVDVSDGLLADAAHLCERSGVAATVRGADVPLSPALAARGGAALDYALSGGDDYELLFTAPADAGEAVRCRAADAGVAVTPIGAITAGAAAVTVVGADGAPLVAGRTGYRHFDGNGK